MSVFVIASLTFTDKDRYRAYQARFAEVFRQSGGNLLVADEAPLALEGEPPDKVVVMQFPDRETARRFLESPAYRAIAEDRKAGAAARAVLVRGLED